jgi:hypothetical protein
VKAALIVAIVLFALAAVLHLIDHPHTSRIALCLTALGLAALAVAHWPGLAP